MQSGKQLLSHLRIGQMRDGVVYFLARCVFGDCYRRCFRL